MESLIRYILMSVGAFILLVVFFLSFRRYRAQRRMHHAANVESLNEVFFDIENQQDQPIEDDAEHDEMINDELEEGVEDSQDEKEIICESEMTIHDDQSENAPKEKVLEEETLMEPSKVKQQDEIIQIAIVAKAGKTFGGYDLLQTLTANHFHFGDMRIFHYHRDMNPTASILFSLASLQKPGDFDLDKIGLFKTKGLVVFMNKADHPEHADHIRELMQEVAAQLAEDLGGTLKY